MEFTYQKCFAFAGLRSGIPEIPLNSASLSLGKSAILSAIIVLPFSIPTLLMGTAVVTSAALGQDYNGFLMIMGAMLAIGIPVISLLTVEALLLNYE